MFTWLVLTRILAKITVFPSVQSQSWRHQIPILVHVQSVIMRKTCPSNKDQEEWRDTRSRPGPERSLNPLWSLHPAPPTHSVDQCCGQINKGQLLKFTDFWGIWLLSYYCGGVDYYSCFHAWIILCSDVKEKGVKKLTLQIKILWDNLSNKNLKKVIHLSPKILF